MSNHSLSLSADTKWHQQKDAYEGIRNQCGARPALSSVTAACDSFYFAAEHGNDQSSDYAEYGDNRGASRQGEFADSLY